MHSPIPRVAHTLNLRFDEYAACAAVGDPVVIPRMGQFSDETARCECESPLIRSVQSEAHTVYVEHRYTDDVLEDDDYRLRSECEALSYQLTGLAAEARRLLLGRAAEAPATELSASAKRGQWPVLVPDDELQYHEHATGPGVEKRLIEHVRSLFFNADAAAPRDPLPLGKLGRAGLPFESYKLALTEDLLDRGLRREAPSRCTHDSQQRDR